MIEDFRRAVADVVEAAPSRPHDVLPLAGTLFQLAGHVPVEERAAALAAIAGRLRTPERIALGAVADLAVLCGALVEVGTPAGPAGVEITRRAREVGAQAMRFAEAWEATGEDDPPHPRETGESHRARVTPVLGDADMYSLASWATMQPYGLAVRAVLSDAEVRSALREDPRGLAELQALSSRMRRHVEEFGEVYELLLMAEADRMLVLDRASGRGFRVRFDGVGDNFQLHTLLADALIGPEGRGVPGQRPMPDWVASATDLRDDPRLSIVEGEWDLVGGDGMWVGNEATPGSVPFVEGERVLVLEPISLKHTWRTGRRHPHIPGWLRVEEELGREEAAAWWGRVHPAGTVVHPLVQSQEETSPVVDVPPEETPGAWNPTDVTPAPNSPENRRGPDPWSPQQEEQTPIHPEPWNAPTDDSWNAVRASGTAPAYEGASGAHGHGGPAESGSHNTPGHGGASDAGGAPGGRPPADTGAGAAGTPGAHGAPGHGGVGGASGGWPPADTGAGAAGTPGVHGAPGYGGAAGAPGASVAGTPGRGDASGGWQSADVGAGAAGAGEVAGDWGPTGAQGAWEASGGVPPGAALVPPPPADRWEVEAEPSIAEGPGADREPPGAGLLEPMPEGVSDSSGWGPSWKS